MRNERYAVEFINKKGEMDFCCGIVEINDVLKMRDPCREAIVYDLVSNDCYKKPVAEFKKLPKQRKWTRIF